MTFYLKYRPKNLNELDLKDVGESLKKIVSSGSIPHAFLFAGPKGTGKTSAARILAKIINCTNIHGVEPCELCDQCTSTIHGSNLDVIEMDAASHRGIDDVRALRDAVKLAPTSSKRKIYIIDEAHMLTTEASNALLKTLEEPPEHVIFILATTNPEKLIDTIRSRTTLIAFRKANSQEIASSLKRVVDAEKIKISDDSLVKIAQMAGGAFRDAIKILEQVSLEGESYLNNYKTSEIQTFISALVKKDSKEAIAEIENNMQKGFTIDIFLHDLLEVLHKALLADVGIGDKTTIDLSRHDLVTLIDLFNEASIKLTGSPIEQLTTEIAIVKWCNLGIKNIELGIKNNGEQGEEEQKFENKNVNLDKEGGGKMPEIGKIKVETNQTPKLETLSSIPSLEFNHLTSSTTNEAESVKSELTAQLNDEIWKNILAAVRPINISIEGLLRSSKPINYDGKVLTLGVFYKFHKERLEDVHHRKIVEDVLEKILNSPTRIMCTIVEPPVKKIIEEAKVETVLTEAKEPDIIKAAEDIFGN